MNGPFAVIDDTTRPFPSTVPHPAGSKIVKLRAAALFDLAGNFGRLG
jgi:hypothetical protein